MQYNLRIITQLRTACLLAGSLTLTAASLCAADQDAAESRQMLSKHQTVAQFIGIKEHKCLGRTSLCPDECGNSGDLATFRILKYIAYDKPGQYGDPQQQEYQFLVQDNRKNLKVSAAVKAAVDALQPNDYVLLDWQHDYVSKAGSKSPERTVTQLKRITREEADRLTGGLEKLPKQATGALPARPRVAPAAR